MAGEEQGRVRLLVRVGQSETAWADEDLGGAGQDRVKLLVRVGQSEAARAD